MPFLPRVLILSLCSVLSLVSTAGTYGAIPDGPIPAGLGVCIFQPSWNQKELERISQIGFKAIRTGLSRNGVDRQDGNYDFAKSDALMEILDKHSITPIFALGGSGRFDEGAAPHTESGREDFARYAGAAAAHFKGRGVIWKIWNEPNLAQYWKPKPSAEDYTRLATAASKAIWASDPDAVVIGPNICGRGFDFLESCCKLGLLDHIDAVSVHPYSCKTPEEAVDYYKTILQITRKYLPPGKDLPIVCEEWGFWSNKDGMTLDKQASAAVRMMLINQMCGIRLTAWFCWLDKNEKPVHRYGLAYPDLKPKPSYLAVSTLIRELSGYRWANRVPPYGEDYVLLFRNGKRCKLAVWTTGKPHRIAIPVDTISARVVGLDGSKATIAVTGGSLTIEIKDAVQFVEPVGRCRSFDTEPVWDWYSGGQLKPEAGPAHSH